MLNVDKITYSIGQVSEIAEIAQSTLRYWETVVASLDPHKTDGGSRRYFKKDVEMVLTIKDLLYNQGFTIKGANQFLNNRKTASVQKIIEPSPINPDTQVEEEIAKMKKKLEYIILELENIKKILD